MQARKLKKGMLVRAQAGYVLVVRQFKLRPPGVKEGELGFTVMSPESARFVRSTLRGSTSFSKVIGAEYPVMYYDTVRTKRGKKSFTKHMFLVGSEVVYLNCNHCRGLEPAAI